MELKKTVIRLFLIFGLLFVIIGCKSNNNIEPSKNINILSNIQYHELISDMSSKINIPKFKILNSTLEDSQRVAVEKSISFNKRAFLTTNGEVDGPKSQERITLVNQKDNYQLFIELIYLDNFVGQDLVYWNVNEDSQKNDDINSRYKDSIMSYKNLLIKTTIISKSGKVDYTELIYADKAIVDYLNNYYSEENTKK
jgi:hypothetical protein